MTDISRQKRLNDYKYIAGNRVYTTLTIQINQTDLLSGTLSKFLVKQIFFLLRMWKGVYSHRTF